MCLSSKSKKKENPPKATITPKTQATLPTLKTQSSFYEQLKDITPIKVDFLKIAKQKQPF